MNAGPGRGSAAQQGVGPPVFDPSGKTRASAPRCDPATRALQSLGGLLLRVPRLAAACLAIAWMGAIYWLSSAPRGPGGDSPGWSYFANLFHGPLFGTLAVLWVASLPRRAHPFPWARMSPRAMGAVLALVGIWSVLDEWHQSHSPGRAASVRDVATNMAAAAAVLWAARAAGEPLADRAAQARRMVRVALVGLTAVALAALIATLKSTP